VQVLLLKLMQLDPGKGVLNRTEIAGIWPRVFYTYLPNCCISATRL